ncbi:MAG: 16S rRNA (cytidine(1402)-2'-O)-methyltransferase [Dehalococcoidia bacterium]|nr:16S rRNA (cytidine(1402)-2'-O)-methyltransferase [Dehalococcoidia bacterium]
MGTLYIIGTPIGNLEDLTYRAVRVLRNVDIVAAEDTRVTRKLLSHLDIHVPMISYHAHNYIGRREGLLEKLSLGSVALVTDAGMPCISDPGSDLVLQASLNNHEVVVIPGVSAVTTALSYAGFPADQFRFMGFLPRKKKDRFDQLEAVADEAHTLVLFESPHRLRNALADILSVLGNCKITVCREMTKMHEEIFTGDIETAISHFDSPRGEFVLVLRNEGTSIIGNAAIDIEKIKLELHSLRNQGFRAKESVAKVVLSTGLPRKVIYDLWLASRNIS